MRLYHPSNENKVYDSYYVFCSFFGTTKLPWGNEALLWKLADLLTVNAVVLFSSGSISLLPHAVNLSAGISSSINLIANVPTENTKVIPH